jgi:hypothetical protein
MKYASLKLIIIIAFVLPILAQQNGLELIDEFGRINDEDRLARTDHLAIRLKNDSGKIALIHISGGRERSPSFNYLFGALIKAQLINQSKIDAGRIEIQNCNVNEPTLKIQYYLAEKNAARPICDASLPLFEKTVHFGTVSSDESSFDDMSCCPVMGGRREILEVFERTIVALLKKNPDAKIVLIGYSGTNIWPPENVPVKPRVVTRKSRKWDSPVIATNMAKKIAARFRASGIDPARMNISNGGYRYEGGHLEFWIVPAGGEKPKAKPDFLIKKSLKKSKGVRKNEKQSPREKPYPTVF